MILFKKKWFWIIMVVVVFLGVVLYLNLAKKGSTNYVTEPAVIGNLVQTVEATGSVEAAEDIDLNFKTSGTLQNITVTVGDRVSAGQVLASLFAGNVASQVADARASLDIAKLELEQLLAGDSDEDIKVTEQELANAKISYQSAVDALDNLEKTRDQELVSLKETLLNTLNDKHTKIQYALDLIHDALLDNDANKDLFVSDVVLLNTTRTKYQLTKNDFMSLYNMINQAQASNDQTDVLTAADFLENNLEDTLDILNKTYDVMNYTVVNFTYTQTVIDTFKANINTNTTVINTAISAVQTASANSRTQDLYYKTQLVDKQNSVDSAKAAMDLAQAKLDFKKAPPRDFEIESAQASIRRAQATLDRYLSDYSETVIKAPVAGIITKVNFDKGEQTSMSQPVISMIGDSNMQIEVDVPESDINKLSVGDQVDITLDAFSTDDKFLGTVIFIDPASTDIDGVVYYRVKVSFNEKNELIKSGMTADLTVSTDSRQGVLQVPSRAVIYREGKKYVQLFDGKNLSEVEVSTGLRGDSGYTEILSGLSEGDQVVTFIKNGN